MNSLFLKALLLASLIFPISAFSIDTIPYENERQVRGAALSSLSTKLPMVINSMSFCTQNDPGFSERSEAVKVAWHKRNDKYLPLGPILLSEMRSQALAEGYKVEWEEFEFVTIPKQIELVANMLVNQLKTLPEGEQRNGMCLTIAKSIDDGFLDMTNDDPKVVTLLNKRLELLSVQEK